MLAISLGEHRASVSRMSHECRANIVKHSPMIRATIVRHSYDCLKYVFSPIRRDRNVIMVAMSYFCHQNVSQISLEIVVNCSHPSEILALSLP